MTLDLTGPAARWTTGRSPLIVVRVDGAIAARECRDCREVKPRRELMNTSGRSRHLCRDCSLLRRTARDAAREAGDA